MRVERQNEHVQGLSTQDMRLQIPQSDNFLSPGSKVKLGRFSQERWVVQFGWYSVNGNRPICGWYLHDIDDVQLVKHLQLPDLSDIFIFEP